MSDNILIIECGVAETRAALIDDGGVQRLWFGPARGDEKEFHTYTSGGKYCGKVLSLDNALAAAFVDIGSATPGFLPLSANASRPDEGALIAVEVRRAPRGQKGAVLAQLEDDVSARGIGPLDEPKDAALQALQIAEDARQIIVDSGSAKSVLDAAGLGMEISHAQKPLFEQYGAADALEVALSREVVLSGGGGLLIDEVEALTAIDVDTGRADGASSARMAGKVNHEAAEQAARQIMLRNIGGQIVIDFLKVKFHAREKLNEKLKTLFPHAQKAGWTKSGLFSFVLPGSGVSLLERFTVADPSSPLGGRRYTNEYELKHFFAAAEQCLRVAPSTAFHICVGAGLMELIRGRPLWIGRLEERYGARMELEAKPSLGSMRFEIAER